MNKHKNKVNKLFSKSSALGNSKSNASLCGNCESHCPRKEVFRSVFVLIDRSLSQSHSAMVGAEGLCHLSYSQDFQFSITDGLSRNLQGTTQTLYTGFQSWRKQMLSNWSLVINCSVINHFCGFCAKRKKIRDSFNKTSNLQINLYQTCCSGAGRLELLAVIYW